MSNYCLATLYSVKENKDTAFKYLTRAIEQGFKDFAAMNSSPRLNFLRNQPEFREYARNGYKLPPVNTTTGEDVITTLSRLGKLKADGVITEEEFSAQKRKFLAS